MEQLSRPLDFYFPLRNLVGGAVPCEWFLITPMLLFGPQLSFRRSSALEMSSLKVHQRLKHRRLPPSPTIACKHLFHEAVFYSRKEDYLFFCLISSKLPLFSTTWLPLLHLYHRLLWTTPSFIPPFDSLVSAHIILPPGSPLPSLFFLLLAKILAIIGS